MRRELLERQDGGLVRLRELSPVDAHLEELLLPAATFPALELLELLEEAHLEAPLEHVVTLLVQQLASDRAEKVLAEGRLTLVDLAGSERQQALLDATSKAAMLESVQINKSLFTLQIGRAHV